MQIEIPLSGYCIERGSKRAYEALIQDYFKSKSLDKTEIENKLEGLRTFLTRADFRALRSHYPFLNGTPPKTVVLRIDSSSNQCQIQDGDTMVDVW